MSILRPITVGPGRRPVVRNPREGNARPIGRVTDHHPVALVLHTPHAQQGFVERGQCVGIVAVDHDAVQSSDHGGQCGIAGWRGCRDPIRHASATMVPVPSTPGFRPVAIKITCGVEAAERANQAWTVAATAIASGAEVTVWLTGEAVWFAVVGRQPDLELQHATPVAELIEAVR